MNKCILKTIMTQISSSWFPYGVSQINTFNFKSILYNIVTFTL